MCSSLSVHTGALEFGGAPASALGPLLQIGQSLSPEDFRLRVVPALSKLFASNDRSVRRSLLESIDTYGAHLTEVSPMCSGANGAGRRRGGICWRSGLEAAQFA